MPDEGWSEPWPRREVDDLGAWQQFVDQLDPAELERERMRVLGDLQAERFGSRQHHETMHAHDYVAEQARQDRRARESRDALDEAHEYNVRQYRIRRARHHRGHAA